MFALIVTVILTISFIAFMLGLAALNAAKWADEQEQSS